VRALLSHVFPSHGFCPRLRRRPTYRVHALCLEIYGVEASRYDGQDFALGSGIQHNKLAMLADPVLEGERNTRDVEPGRKRTNNNRNERQRG
jgi:hypothetical protein